MFAMKPERVREWVASEFPGDTFETHLNASLNSPQYSAPGSHTISSGDFGDSGRAAFIESLELDPDKQVGFMVTHTVYALTDRRLCIATTGGLRPRPKELLHAGPREGLTVHWYDGRAEAGNQFRHFVFVFADGAWRGDRTGIKILGRTPKANLAHRFIEALGPAAFEVR
ncbi:hypothetical protein YM304_13770 [Ilumatobacter coccineus YM16-304]|uniref:Uncharacterized protein n=2 Tax=Ilumatobacter coccineus TaxID=467094 RepID=A0A6C7E530_ILUCY|nr:hypothetical protein YM304_13770 [Ilumatobacter coccineus YM16-304]